MSKKKNNTLIQEVKEMIDEDPEIFEKLSDQDVLKIEKEYASILVYEMSTINDGATLANSAYKLRRLDQQLKKMGLRATIKIGIEKIA